MRHDKRDGLYSLLRKRRGAGSITRGGPHIAHDRGLVLPKRVQQTTRRLRACTYRHIVSEENTDDIANIPRACALAPLQVPHSAVHKRIPPARSRPWNAASTQDACYGVEQHAHDQDQASAGYHISIHIAAQQAQAQETTHPVPQRLSATCRLIHAKCQSTQTCVCV